MKRLVFTHRLCSSNWMMDLSFLPSQKLPKPCTLTSLINRLFYSVGCYLWKKKYSRAPANMIDCYDSFKHRLQEYTSSGCDKNITDPDKDQMYIKRKEGQKSCGLKMSTRSCWCWKDKGNCKCAHSCGTSYWPSSKKIGYPEWNSPYHLLVLQPEWVSGGSNTNDWQNY